MEYFKMLYTSYKDSVSGVLKGCMVITIMLNHAWQDILRLSQFKPRFIISDKAGQCLEGDQCIILIFLTV
ncbi:hypothetical protein BDW42DRAFT_172080 [Aspergillus taichungensis]|uniref:Uncharacterized protein n=1 Tax=Aspergillus taichungensis TaxID=482145 RepID=A0A2J5HR64_9EURO|nr:hypothetical protein BDW42DRAFT_172080 [Aspergillus taichungensis]